MPASGPRRAAAMHEFSAPERPRLRRHQLQASAIKSANPRPHTRSGVRGRRDRKPSPVLASVTGTRATIIHLGCTSPRTSSDATRRLGRTTLERLPISSCSEWGLPCDRRCRRPGELLPRLFTLTARFARSGGMFSAALSLGSPPPAVSWHSVLWSSDFPPAARAGDRLLPSDAATHRLWALGLQAASGLSCAASRRGSSLEA